MSAETRAALDSAVSAHVADETGDLTVAWVVAAGRIGTQLPDDGKSRLSTYAPDSQEAWTTLGLLNLSVCAFSERCPDEA